MADEPEKSGQEPNLELPSLFGFGRRKKARQGGVAPAETGVEPALPQTPEAQTPDAEPSGGLAPAAGTAKRPPPVPPPSAGDDAPVRPPAEPPAQPPAEPPAQPPAEPPAQPRAEEPDGPVPVEPWRREVSTAGDGDTERTEIIEPAVDGPDTSSRGEQPLNRAGAVETSAIPVARSGGAPTAQQVAAPVHDEPAAAVGEPDDDEPAAQAPATRRRRSSITLPDINPRVAAFLTGVVVGLVGVGLGFAVGRGCEIVRGVGSCGRIGGLALVVILVVQVVLGSALLKAWRFSDPVSTSFLGVGLVAVFVMLFLLGALTSVWTLLFIPVLSGLTYTLSWWVTAAFADGANRS